MTTPAPDPRPPAWSVPVLRLSRFQVYDPSQALVEGHAGRVVYELEHQDGRTDYLAQRFVLGRARYDELGGPLWSWDGDLERPSLVPSYIGAVTPTDRPPVHVHLYLQRGRVILLGDSTCTLGEPR